MMNIWNIGLKKGLGSKFKDGICAELRLKLWFENDWFFYNITNSEWFWKWLCRNKVPDNDFFKLIWKSNCLEVHCETLIKYQLPHTQSDQISDHKHDIYLYGKLTTNLLAQAAIF